MKDVPRTCYVKNELVPKKIKKLFNCMNCALLYVLFYLVAYSDGHRHFYFFNILGHTMKSATRKTSRVLNYITCGTRASI